MNSPASPHRALRHYGAWYAAGLVFAFLIAMPLLWPGHFSRPLYASALAQNLAKAGLVALTLIVPWLALHGAPVSRQMRIVTWGLCLAIACMCENVHYWVVDKGHYFPASMFADNTAWQQHMQHGILRLKYEMSPHSYRFLSHSLVGVYYALTGHFELARIIYRIMCHALLFVMVFRYARLYVSTPAAAVGVIILGALYPQLVFHYAGQFVDPASYLSFATCLYCLAARYEPLFGPALFLGVFAKESVIVMAICRAFYGADRRRAILSAAGYLAVALVLVIAIRVEVSGALRYNNISGVGLGHVFENVTKWYPWWVPLWVCTLGVMLPGALLGMRYLGRAFQGTCAVVVVSIVVSSAMFSWLAEIRNVGPALIPLLVANLRYAELRVRLATI